METKTSIKTSVFIYLVSAIIINSLFTSCSIGKRKYMSGYNIEWKHKKNNIETRDYVNNESKETREIKKEEPLMASTENKIQYKKEENKSLIIESCDVITMKNGDEIKAKIIELTESQIKYKPCNDLDGPIRSIEKQNAFMIKYVNGTKEMFDKEEKVKVKTKNIESENIESENHKKKVKSEKTYSKSKNWAAIVGFILAFLFPFAGIWFCIIGTKSELHTLAWIGYWICIVYFLIIIAIFLLL